MKYLHACLTWPTDLAASCLSSRWTSRGLLRPRRCAGLFVSLVLLLCLICPCVRSHAQEAADSGTIAGLVIDNWNQQGLAGVIVTVRGTTLATTTEFDGRYELRGVPGGEHIVVFSKGGYARTIVSEVRVAPGQITKVDNALRPEFYEMEEYEVTAAQLEEQMVSLLSDRQGASVIKDSIGSDFFDRAGAGDAGEIMTKVTGASVVDGKYVYIRGLGERYSLTTLNGSFIPSADPDKRAVQMDIFPSDAIERIETSKTFTPDQPGSFSGGNVNIVTKKYPEQFFLKASLGMGYNSQSTFNDDFLTYDGGDTDWAAFDDGTRAIPGEWSEYAPQRTVDLINETRSGGGRTPASRQAAAEEVVRLTNAFEEELVPYTDAPPPDLSFSASLGDKMELFGRPLGYMVGVNYDRKYRFYDDGFIGRYNAVGNVGMKPTRAVTDVKGAEEVNWGSLVNLAYQFHENHELAFTFLFNRNSDDVASYQYGLKDSFEDELSERYILHYTERELQSYQLRGRHDFEEVLNAFDTTTEWAASYGVTSQDEPDLRYFEFIRDDSGRPDIPLSGVLEPTRYWRELDEDNFNLKWDQTIPFKAWAEPEGKVKFGLLGSATERTYQDRRFGYGSNSRPRYAHFAQSGDETEFLDPANITYTPSVFGAYQFNTYLGERPYNRYDGTFDLAAGYGMVELPLFSRLKAIGGVRYEMSEIQVDNQGEFTGSSDLKENDLLPAASLLYEVVTNMNVRLAYGKTLARPTFDEIALAPRFDFLNDEILIGNPDLQQTSIDNYDLRWEWFRRPGEVLAASVFYKTLELPIEKTIVSANNQVQYQNREEASLYGFELEGRTRLDFIDPLLEYFSIGANFAWVKSQVDADPFEYEYVEEGQDSRPLQGQSPYIVNADLTFDNAFRNKAYATTVSLFYNLFGERLSEVSRVSPNVYEQPVHTMDLTIAQRLGPHLQLKFAAKNLLNPTYEKLIEFQGDDYTYSSYTKGRTYTLGLSYEW